MTRDRQELLEAWGSGSIGGRVGDFWDSIGNVNEIPN